MKKNELYDNVIPIAAYSYVAAEIWNAPIKFIFIDGAHRFSDVSRDFNLFDKFVVSGGVVAFHDVFVKEENDIYHFVQHVASQGKYKLIGINESVGVLQKY